MAVKRLLGFQPQGSHSLPVTGRTWPHQACRCDTTVTIRTGSFQSEVQATPVLQAAQTTAGLAPAVNPTARRGAGPAVGIRPLQPRRLLWGHSTLNVSSVHLRAPSRGGKPGTAPGPHLGKGYRGTLLGTTHGASLKWSKCTEKPRPSLSSFKFPEGPSEVGPGGSGPHGIQKTIPGARAAGTLAHTGRKFPPRGHCSRLSPLMGAAKPAQCPSFSPTRWVFAGRKLADPSIGAPCPPPRTWTRALRPPVASPCPVWPPPARQRRVTEGPGRSRCPGADQPLSHAQWVRSSAVCGGQWLPCAWRDAGQAEESSRTPALLPLRPGRPSPCSWRGRAACGMRPRPPAWGPQRVTCTPGAGPSPALGPTSAAAAAPSRPHGPAPAPRARSVCKYESPAANCRPGRARPATPQPVGARRVRTPRPPPRGPSRARPARSFPHVGLGAGPPPAGRGLGRLSTSSRAAPPPARPGGSTRGAVPRPPAAPPRAPAGLGARSPGREPGPGPRRGFGTHGLPASPAPISGVWLAGPSWRGLGLCPVCPRTPQAGPGRPGPFRWDGSESGPRAQGPCGLSPALPACPGIGEGESGESVTPRGAPR